MSAVLLTLPIALFPGKLSRSLLAHADSKLETKTIFLHYIIHELRIPMQSVSSGLQIATGNISEAVGRQHINQLS